jgi:hypothetical protein
MDRAISPSEAAIIRWLLDHALVCEVPGYRELRVEELRVIGGCGCGCISVEFDSNAWSGAQIVSDALAVYEDGQQAGLILWGREGRLVLLEAYDCHPDSSHRTPEVSNLRALEFEDRGPNVKLVRPKDPI